MPLADDLGRLVRTLEEAGQLADELCPEDRDDSMLSLLATLVDSAARQAREIAAAIHPTPEE